jgi:hypothetical protein
MSEEVTVAPEDLIAALQENDRLCEAIQALEMQIDSYQMRQQQLRDEACEKLKAMFCDADINEDSYEFVKINGKVYAVNLKSYYFPLEQVSCLDFNAES